MSKSNLSYFPTKVALCMTNFTMDKSKTDTGKLTFNQDEHIFPFCHSDKLKPSSSSFFSLLYDDDDDELMLNVLRCHLTY